MVVERDVVHNVDAESDLQSWRALLNSLLNYRAAFLLTGWNL
jgi:hypothetical protein